jgi:hypothetical protein
MPDSNRSFLMTTRQFAEVVEPPALPARIRGWALMAQTVRNTEFDQSSKLAQKFQ